MRSALLRLLISLVAGVVLVRVHQWWTRGRETPGRESPLRGILIAISWISILTTLWVVCSHIGFPLHLDIMEGTVFQHLQRAVTGQPLYPAPTAEFIPLAYNPLYYYVAIPFTWIFGSHLWTLRLVSVLAMVGIAVVLFLAVRGTSQSSFWGLASAGLFAASYRAMEAYLDTAHSDACYILAALLGTYLLQRFPNRWGTFTGILVLISSFWFKQHGALFTLGGLLYVTWRDGWKVSIPSWGMAVLLGFVGYVWVGPFLFGSHFHYFTWEVPSSWSEFSIETVTRYGKYLLKYEAFLLAPIALNILRLTFRYPQGLNLWFVQFVVAIQTGLMGALDRWSADNVFICAQVWTILVGCQSLADLARRRGEIARREGHLVAVLVSFALVAYNPLSLLPRPDARECYRDFISYLKGIQGTVFAPSLGQIEKDYQFYPGINWVPLEDMIRGPGLDTTNHPRVRELLKPLFGRDHPVYILENIPLKTFPFFRVLNDSFVLEQDLGDRFKPLAILPRRFDPAWPRYLYRYAPEEAATARSEPD